MTIKVVYENGVFRPLKPRRDIKESTEGEVTINVPPRTVPSPEEVVEAFTKIANMPVELGGKHFNGEDHDKILYGDPHRS
jgi:predicted DNA-binding antitoxin AbrB/MazE fold protein